MSVAVSLATGSSQEMEVRDRLVALFGRYDLRKWEFTDRVRIEEGAISHSHPVLTITAPLPGDTLLLATYLHEQIHWFTLVPANAEADRCVTEAWRKLYPAVPVEYPEGCGSEFSTYLHFTVTYLEYCGLVEVLGEAEARRLLEYKIKRPFYRYVYRAVLQDFDRMSAVVTRCGLVL